MATFALVHGAGDVGWSWHLVQQRLERRGHRTVAPDLPGDDATLADCADTVLSALAALAGAPGLQRTVVVGHSFGAFTAPLVAERIGADALVLVAGMVPAPGERPDDWWDRTGWAATSRADHDGQHDEQRDEQRDEADDLLWRYYHDVPTDLAFEAIARTRDRDHPSAAAGVQPWPLPVWPAIPTRVVLGTADRLFPVEFLRRVVRERLGGVTVDEIAAGHCVALSRPDELAALLDAGADHPDRRG
jgi:pimeloyl-ACP methyl ester carboxylesterase